MVFRNLTIKKFKPIEMTLYILREKEGEDKSVSKSPFRLLAPATTDSCGRKRLF